MNNLLCTVHRKIFFYGVFLFSINLIPAMQSGVNYFALAERFINDATQSCGERTKIKKTDSSANSALSLRSDYLEPRRDFLTALQHLLNAHAAGHKTSLLLAKQVFEIIQKIESIRLEDRRGRPLSLSPEIATTVSKLKIHDNKNEQISWQEFVYESYNNKDYADYDRLQKNLAKSMDVLMHK